MKELEDDIVTLHEKAAHDMETLRELHSRELAAKSSQGNFETFSVSVEVPIQCSFARVEVQLDSRSLWSLQNL